MDYKEIKLLIDKYWRCETSVEEEKILKDFFSREPVPEDLAPFAGLFKYYSSLSGIAPAKKFSPEIPEKAGIPLKQSRARSKMQAWYYRAAAAVFLILAIFIINEQIVKLKRETAVIVKDTFQNPEEALAQTKKILLSVSRELYKGEKEAVRLGEFSRAEDIFRKSKSKNK